LRCHVHEGGKLVTERFAVESVDFCQECHSIESRGMTHPLKVGPNGKVKRMKIPPEFRLAEGEKMVCLTCHTAHGPFLSTSRTFLGQAPDGARSGGGTHWYRTFFLRRSDPNREGFGALCEGCHGKP
jgi:hypothetical protein